MSQLYPSNGEVHLSDDMKLMLLSTLKDNQDNINLNSYMINQMGQQQQQQHEKTPSTSKIALMRSLIERNDVEGIRALLPERPIWGVSLMQFVLKASVAAQELIINSLTPKHLEFLDAPNWSQVYISLEDLYERRLITSGVLQKLQVSGHLGALTTAYSTISTLKE
ncbi:hypothetical protein SAMD00019534_117530 [Acytostelium subglobosum LB1]|uniref:hypothetical protein n=1 Tax=Acytostelium subglobosum LB1 TaxID=1410327 RepID=UPI00064489BD|nr:hypothetical protein SAMD00019534_117530 [Acytostelium subglobosum LB1]GAM28577.1 hypothetical protein SAMD00019534_117530 [Acytostelium subglobosum LB1]|eukprot:XP_012748355.1 hypothetical protein SAMD00019534_117530 [Acytostelium subglobosum LB1]